MKANGPRVLEEVNLKREREEERRRARASAFTNDVRSEPGAHGAPARGARPGAPAGPAGNTDGYGRRHRKRLGVVARNTLEAYYEKDKYPSVRSPAPAGPRQPLTGVDPSRARADRRR